MIFEFKASSDWYDKMAKLESGEKNFSAGTASMTLEEIRSILIYICWVCNKEVFRTKQINYEWISPYRILCVECFENLGKKI